MDSASNPRTIIALDYGEKRIGIAIGNTASRLPSPLMTLANNENTLQALTELLGQHNADALVVGVPRGLKGQETPQTLLIREFIELLKKSFSVLIYSQDEDLSSVRAEKELKERKIRYNKQSVDALAATYILEDFFKEHPETHDDI